MQDFDKEEDNYNFFTSFFKPILGHNDQDLNDVDYIKHFQKRGFW